jgi:hypothetical protein
MGTPCLLIGLALSYTLNVSGNGGDASSPIVALLAEAYWVNAGAVLALSYNRLVWDWLRQPSDA